LVKDLLLLGTCDADGASFPLRHSHQPANSSASANGTINARRLDVRFGGAPSMKQREQGTGSERLQRVRNLLTHLREVELARINEFRRDEAQDAVTEPTDNMDIARSEEELELHASLLARSEDHLNQIREAFERLEEGTYGLCRQCKREIPIERLTALPFAVNCEKCEEKVRTKPEVGKMDDQFLHRWDVPEGMVESLGRDDMLKTPRENSRVLRSRATPFAPSPAIPEAKPLPSKKLKPPRK
jgi:DnaK suppressor protein